MQHTEPGELSYTELERRIKALPEGPASVFTTPKPFAIAGVIGNAGIILGLLPSLLATFMTPQMWMVWAPNSGWEQRSWGARPSSSAACGSWPAAPIDGGWIRWFNWITTWFSSVL